MTTIKSYQDGLAEGRSEGIRTEQIRRTVVHLRKLMRRLDMSLDDAMSLLELPRKDRETYRRILRNQKG